MNKTCLVTGALGVPTKIHARVDDDLLRGAICDRHCDLDSALLASLPMAGLWGLMLKTVRGLATLVPHSP